MQALFLIRIRGEQTFEKNQAMKLKDRTERCIDLDVCLVHLPGIQSHSLGQPAVVVRSFYQSLLDVDRIRNH